MQVIVPPFPSDLRVHANPFVSQQALEDEKLFDELEKRFVAYNSFIFEYTLDCDTNVEQFEESKPEPQAKLSKRRRNRRSKNKIKQTELKVAQVAEPTREATKSITYAQAVKG